MIDRVDRDLDFSEAALIVAHFNELRARYPEYRKWTRASRAATSVRGTGRSGWDFTPEEREELYRKQRDRGGPGFTGVFTDILSDQKINDQAADFVRDKIRR